MEHPLQKLWNKKERLGIGLMSGTSADGIDAVLISISGCGTETRLKQLAFCFTPYTVPVREAILRLAEGQEGGSRAVCEMNFLLGELSAQACLRLCNAAHISPNEVDFVGSHGQTIYHIPEAEEYLGISQRSTLQIGEASLICEKMGCPVVSDFRVRDVAAGGLGAPLVPYTEFLMYRSVTENVALQNIGGIGNITLLPKACALSEVVAFDTGPGNMVMDALVSRLTQGKQSYDEGGRLAAQGKANEALLAFLMDDPYLREKPPKTTGRERYGKAYVQRLADQAEALGLSPLDALATATRFTAECIRYSIDCFCTEKPSRLIVGGGGALNPVLMGDLRNLLPECRVMTNEELGFDGNAKEAVAFAILANEALFAHANNAQGATGAKHPVVMGKISL